MQIIFVFRKIFFANSIRIYIPNFISADLLYSYSSLFNFIPPNLKSSNPISSPNFSILLPLPIFQKGALHLSYIIYKVIRQIYTNSYEIEKVIRKQTNQYFKSKPFIYYLLSIIYFYHRKYLQSVSIIFLDIKWNFVALFRPIFIKGG